MNRKLYYTLHSGKNNKALYYLRSYIRLHTPRCILRPWLARRLRAIDSRPDRDAILRRADYYCRLTADTPFCEADFMARSTVLGRQPMTRQKVYYLDTMQYARWFPQRLRWLLEEGDVDYLLPLPAITKSRPLQGDNRCSVLLNLDKVRHFIFVDDRKTFAQKKDGCIFRGRIAQHSGQCNRVKQGRYDFVSKFYGHPLCDVGVIDKNYPQWHSAKLTIGEQLEYKFVMSLEGNDVASNLKWIMSSNSIAVMPRPTCETWFMEGTLQPDVHYIEVQPDYSDLIDKLNHYISHPDEAQTIIENAHAYIDQFRHPTREDLVSLLVLDRYFARTNAGYRPLGPTR